MISENVKKILEKLENYSTDVNVQYKTSFILIPTSITNCYLSFDSIPYKLNSDDSTYMCYIECISIYPSEVKGFEIRAHGNGVLKNITEAEKAILEDAIRDLRKKIQDTLTDHYMSLL